MGNALVAAERWLYGVLSADATLAALVGADNVHGHIIKGGDIYPLVFYTLPGAGDNVLTLQAELIWSEFLYAVRIVDQVESYTPLEAGAAAIEAALSRASGSNVSGVVVACVYQAPFVMLELDRDGYEIRHLGGLYRLYVQ